MAENIDKKVKDAGNKQEPRIDSDVPWYEEHNRDAARKLRVKYDKNGRVYRDSDGCPTLDEFGQPLG